MTAFAGMTSLRAHRPETSENGIAGTAALRALPGSHGWESATMARHAARPPICAACYFGGGIVFGHSLCCRVMVCDALLPPGQA